MRRTSEANGNAPTSSPSLAAGLLRGPLLLRPREVQVDDGLGPRRARRDLLADGGGQRAGRVVELLERPDRGHQPGRPVLVEDVVGDDEGAARHVEDPEVVQLVLAVVPPRQHLEHRLPLGDPLRPAARRGSGRSARGWRPARRSARPGSAPRRPTSAASSPRTPARTLDRSWSTSGWSNQRNRMLRARSPTIGNRSWVARDQPVEQLADPRRRRTSSGGGSAIQRCSMLGDQLDVGAGTPLGEVDPEDRLLQLRGAVQLGHAVPRQHRGEPVAEVLVQAVPLDVEALQVGVEVLPGAVHAQLGVLLLAAGAVAAQLGELGEQAEQLDLAGDHVPPGGAGLLAGARGSPPGSAPRCPGRRRTPA